MSAEGPLSLLVVEDDERLRERLVRAFRERGFLASGAPDGEAALAHARVHPPDRAVVDLRMPGMSGLDVVRELKRIRADTRVVVLTGYGSIATAVEAVKLGAVQYVPKPADVDDLLAALAGQPPVSAAAAAPPRGVPGPAAGDSEHPVPSLARVEWEHIHRVLQACGGNVSKAARLLGLPRRSLQRKLAKYPVPR